MKSGINGKTESTITSRQGKNSSGVPLYYVIRKDTPSPEDNENRYVKIIYQASLVGNMLTRDSRIVLYIIKEPTLGTESETWIKVLNCDRKAMQELQAHYDETSEGARRNKSDRSDLKRIFYKNETTLTFEKYVIKIKGIFNVLEKYGVPIYVEQMVENLLE